MKSEKFILFTLAAIQFTHIVDVMIMMPLGDIFMRLFNIGAKEFSLLVSAYAFGAFASSLIGAMFIDRFDRKKALVFVYTGFVVGTLLCAFAPSYRFLLAIRFFTGIFGGVIGALALSIISDVFPFERRGSAMGILMGSFSVASAIGVPLGLYLADKFNWQAPFLFVGSVGSLIVALLIFQFPSMKSHLAVRAQGEKAPPLLQVFSTIAKDKNQVNALALGVILVLGHMVIIPFIAPYMRRNVGFSQSDLTYIYAIGGILTAFSSPFIGKLTDKFGAMRTFMTIMLISFIPVLTITNLPPVTIPIALVATSVFFVLGSGRMIPPQTMITAAVGKSGRGSFMSVKAALQQLGIGVASLIGGWVIYIDDAGALHNYGWVGALSVTIGLISIWLGTRLKVVKSN